MASKSEERRFLARESPEDLQVARTDGSFLFDAEGKQYVDFMMGWCVGNFGWGNAVLLEATRHSVFDVRSRFEFCILLVPCGCPGLRQDTDVRMMRPAVYTWRNVCRNSPQQIDRRS